MASFNEDVCVQVRISRDTPQGRFQDAIYLPIAEFEAMKDEDIEALKDERVAGWLSAVEAAKQRPIEKPTRAELEEAKARALAEVAEIDDKLARGDHKIGAVR